MAAALKDEYEPFLRGGGEMGAYIRAHDWAMTSLGPITAWPSELKTAVGLMLGATQPVYVAFGPELTSLYNDAYLPIVGTKHPAGFGAPFASLWAEIWGSFEPIVEATMAGDAQHFVNLPIALAGRPGMPMGYFTFSYTALRNADGKATGFYCAATETTTQVLADQFRAADAERSKHMLQQMPGFVAHLQGPKHVFRYVNDAYREFAGPHRPLLGETIRAAFPEIADQGFYDLLDAVYSTGEPYSALSLPIEIHHEGEGQATRFVDLLYAPMRDDAGSVSGIFVGGYDVTERVQAERQLHDLTMVLARDVEERTQERDRLWASSEDLLVVADYDGNFLRLSPSWSKLTGSAATELLANAYTEFTHPDDREPSMAKVAAMREDHLPARFENRIRGLDGSWHRIAWTLSPEEGGLRFNGIGRDITQERSAEAALRDTEDFARLALSAVGGVGVWTYDIVSDTFFCDPAISALYGHDPKEGAAGLKRAEFLKFVVQDDQAPLNGVMSGGLKRPGDLELEYRIDHPDGSTRWVLSRGHTYFDERGRPVRRTGIGVETTRQRSLEEQLRQSQKMEALGQLTGGIAHDFNNLLTVIRGSADLLRRPSVSEEKRQRYIDAVADTADRASKLTSQLLSFARRQALSPEVFDAGASVIAMRDMIETLTGAQIDLVIKVADCPCHVHADHSQFDTAIVNMAVNARDAMKGQGTITITVGNVDHMPAVRGNAAIEGDFVTVAISDTGAGIVSEQLDKIFEPFFTTKGVGEGTGLGLSQVFGFAKQSGGEILVTSDEGEGATFTLYLSSAQSEEILPEVLQDTLRRQTTGACVLVVEDNPEVGQFVADALAELGYHTKLVIDGATALDELSQSPATFDVVFSDVVMPGMSGIELGQEIRRRFPTLPVILTSGYSAVLAQNGTCGFELLRKPYSIEELSETLQRVQE